MSLSESLSEKHNQLNKQHNFKSCIWDHLKRLINQSNSAELMKLVNTQLEVKDYQQYTEVPVLDSETGKVTKERHYGVTIEFKRKLRDQLVTQIRRHLPDADIKDDTKVAISKLLRLYRKMDKVLEQKDWKAALTIVRNQYGSAYY